MARRQERLVSVDSKSSPPACSKMTIWGLCCQPAWTSSPFGWCRSHQTWFDRGVTPEVFYEEKIAKAWTQPTFDYLSDSEAHALLNGRYRGDGRRVDQYVIDDPLGFDL